jgi:hypothetical protein
MGMIYGSAVLTIIAAGGEDADAGLLVAPLEGRLASALYNSRLPVAFYCAFACRRSKQVSRTTKCPAQPVFTTIYSI